MCKLVGPAGGLRMRDLNRSQCHDGFSSKGAARTIKNTIKVDGLCLDSVDQPGFHLAILTEKAVKLAAYWTIPDVPGKAIGQKRHRTAAAPVIIRHSIRTRRGLRLQAFDHMLAS